MKSTRQYAAGCVPLRGRTLIFCLLMVLFLPAPGFGQDKDHILVLHSYNKGLTWTDSEDAGIEAVLRTRRPQLEVHTEYLDTKLRADAEHYQRFSGLLKHKYAGVAIRVVLCTDDNAYNFALRNRATLFPAAPIVFCGVNYFQKMDEGLTDVVTGVVEAFDLPATLRTALRLHPQATKVIVINDRTTTGLANRKVLDELIPEFAQRVSFVFFDDLTMAELLAKVRSLSPDDVILLLTFNRDRTGQVFTYDDSIARIAKEAPAPLYGVWDFYLGKGIVGGMLTSGTDQGRTAAEMVLRILDGEKVRDIPVIRESPNKYKFDYPQMTRFGITLADLPPGSTVLNQPVSFYQSHKWVVWGGIAGFAGFTLIIFLLLGFIRQRLHAEKKLVESENRFRSLSDDALVGIYIIQDNLFRYINPKMVEIFGYGVEELVDKISPRELALEEDWPTVRDNLQKRLSDEQRSIHYEFRGVRKDKSIVFLEVFGSRTVIQGKPAVIGTLLDITERKRAEDALQKLNDELEQRIAERTADLEESRTELEMQNEELRETSQALAAETAALHRAMEELQEKDRMVIQQSRMAAMGEMLGNIAHQWRQPFNALGLMVQDLGLSYESGEFSKELLDTNIGKVMEILLHLSQTIDDFSNFATPDKDKTLFKVDQVIVQTISLIEESFKNNHIALDLNSSDDPQINGYPHEYAQVLLNILMNARDAFLESRRDHARIDVRSWVENGRSVVTITDNAGGIKTDILGKIFEPYFTTKDLGMGTGVGLFLSKTIIEKNMGGRLSASNTGDGVELRIEV